MNNIKIAIASGKGGTGKTLLSTNLATLLNKSQVPVELLDFDVEAPNDHIFFPPDQTVNETEVNLPSPVVDHETCNLCGTCAEVCQFGAIALVKEKVMIFNEMCHSCSACIRFCPENAMAEDSHQVGNVKVWTSDSLKVVEGKTLIGETASVALIKGVKEKSSKRGISLIDAPPGTSCPVVETMFSADFILMITEPTPFGLHDLKMSVSLARKLNKNFAIILNRSDLGDNSVQAFCQKEEIPILMELPFQKKIAEIYSSGKLLINESPDFKEKMQKLWADLNHLLTKEGLILQEEK